MSGQPRPEPPDATTDAGQPASSGQASGADHEAGAEDEADQADGNDRAFVAREGYEPL